MHWRWLCGGFERGGVGEGSGVVALARGEPSSTCKVGGGRRAACRGLGGRGRGAQIGGVDTRLGQTSSREVVQRTELDGGRSALSPASTSWMRARFRLALARCAAPPRLALLPMATHAYTEQVNARHARFRPPKPALDRTSAYHIDAQFSIPHHQTQIHAFAAPPCSSHLYTGGSDGYVRRYALYATLNGSGVDNPLVPNLTSKIGGHERPPGTDTRQPVLTGYWENEEPQPDWIDDLLEPPTTTPDTPSDQVQRQQQQQQQQQQRKAARVRWGPKTGAWGPQSAVYSLAVQKEELWGLSGTSVRSSGGGTKTRTGLLCADDGRNFPPQRGSVNLWTVRHDEGQIRHVFRSAASPTADPSRGHSPKAAVSVLALDQDEKSFLSGGWDGRIFVSLFLLPSEQWSTGHLGKGEGTDRSRGCPPPSACAAMGPRHGRPHPALFRPFRSDLVHRVPSTTSSSTFAFYDERRRRHGRRCRVD